MRTGWGTRVDARSLNLEIPAPRGQIVDRNGIPFAQTKVCNYLALQLPANAGEDETRAVKFARNMVAEVNAKLGTEWDLKESDVIDQHKHRRWSPLVFSTPLSDAQLRKIEPLLDEGLILFPTYCRAYPQAKSACHIIGYTGRETNGSSGQLVSGDPLFSHRVGRDGLELSLDEYLTGTPGEIHQLFDEAGNKLVEELVRRPVPGNNVVMTLDLGMQKLAEDTLSRYCRRGALVVIDVKTGDVLALASRPDYDPNAFVPSISETEFAALRDDPANPMFARAFRGAYPPASTYKVVTALAALEAGVVDGGTLVDSPGSMKIGGRYFKNWHSGSEGRINVERALARSCNTWFYKIGMKTGAESFASMSLRLGYGQRTGIPLAAEAPGFVPTDENMMEQYGHLLRDGYLANASIGQGHVLASPLQVAQMMAAVGNGNHLQELRLVRTIQDMDGEVVKSYPVTSRNALNLSPEHLQLVRDGLYDVVNAGHGTGRNAANGYHTVAGKTGTGQWGPPSKRQYVAWFAGFVPAHDPQYAFAALYEGRPGESLTGGKKAAPMIASYFRNLYGGRTGKINSAALAKLGLPTDLLVEKRASVAAERPKVTVVTAKKKEPVAAPAQTVPRAKRERPLVQRIFGKRRR